MAFFAPFAASGATTSITVPISHVTNDREFHSREFHAGEGDLQHLRGNLAFGARLSVAPRPQKSGGVAKARPGVFGVHERVGRRADAEEEGEKRGDFGEGGRERRYAGG